MGHAKATNSRAPSSRFWPVSVLERIAATWQRRLMAVLLIFFTTLWAYGLATHLPGATLSALLNTAYVALVILLWRAIERV